MATGIYVIVNRVNGKQYVGSAVDMTRRWREHRRRIANGTHHNEIISRAWEKHGEDAFEFRPLFVCRTEDLLFYEQRAIDALKPEYNICSVAGSMLGVKRKPFSAEHRAALSAARKLRQKETRTEEQKRRMSDAQKKSFAGGQRKPRPPISEATKLKISLSNKGNTNGRFTKGISKPPISEETRAKLSAASAGRVVSEETKERMRMAWAKRKEGVSAHG